MRRRWPRCRCPTGSARCFRLAPRDSRRIMPATAGPYPFADLALARRVEGGEAEGSGGFMEAGARLVPERGSSWIEVAGTYAMFDGPASPLTQTFGFGLFASASAVHLDELEGFFRDRGSPVFHE